MANDHGIPLDRHSCLLNRGIILSYYICAHSFLQVIYKIIWLVFYVLPRLKNAASRKEIHWGIAVSFLLIVIFYPMVIPWSALFP
jgi:hypothetical protein